MKPKESNLGFSTKKRIINVIAYGIVFVSIFTFVIIVIDTLVKKYS